MSDWRDEAACRWSDPDLFFPEPGTNPNHAKRICATCPVAAQCLLFAVAMVPAPEGVWGGFTPMQRRRLRLAAA